MFRRNHPADHCGHPIRHADVGRRDLGICEEEDLYPYVTFVQPSQDEILDVYRQADIYTLPSYADAFPVALLEAMSASLPVVSTFTGGIPEILDGDAGGILIQPGDVDRLGHELLRLAASSDLRMELGEANRLRVQDRYSPELVTRQVDELYESLLSDYPRYPTRKEGNE